MLFIYQAATALIAFAGRDITAQAWDMSLSPTKAQDTLPWAYLSWGQQTTFRTLANKYSCTDSSMSESKGQPLDCYMSPSGQQLNLK